MSNFLFDSSILYGEVGNDDYPYIWANLNKMFDSEIGDIFNNEDNGFYYTELIRTIDFDKVTDQFVVDLIAACVESNSGRFVEYFQDKFPGIKELMRRARPLAAEKLIYNDGSSTVRNRYLKKYNIYIEKAY